MITTTFHTDLVRPGDPRYDEARSSFNLLVDQRPAAVAFPSDADEVAVAVAQAQREGLRVAPQARGHNQAPLGDMALVAAPPSDRTARRARRAPPSPVPPRPARCARR